jgi:hypothetical protein
LHDLHDLHDLDFPPLDLRLFGDFGDGMRGTVLEKACMAVLHNATGILQSRDWFGPAHLHGRIMSRGFGLGCIENLSIANRPIAPIAPIAPSRWIILVMTLFTLASICTAASRSSWVSSDRI